VYTVSAWLAWKEVRTLVRELISVRFQTENTAIAEELSRDWAGRRHVACQLVHELTTQMTMDEILRFVGPRPRVLLFLWNGVLNNDPNLHVLKRLVDSLRSGKLLILAEISSALPKSSERFRTIFKDSPCKGVRYLHTDCPDTAKNTLVDWIEEFLRRPTV